jgi:hypothetical protein
MTGCLLNMAYNLTLKIRQIDSGHQVSWRILLTVRSFHDFIVSSWVLKHYLASGHNHVHQNPYQLINPIQVNVLQIKLVNWVMLLFVVYLKIMTVAQAYRSNNSGQSMTFITHLHLVPRLSISGVIPLLLLYAFIVWAGTTLPFYFIFYWLSIMKWQWEKNVSFNDARQ